MLRLGIWTKDIKEAIILNNGSVKDIQGIPKFIQDIFKVSWDISMRSIIDQAADRGIYICQSQSMNLWMAQPTHDKLTSMHFYSWKKGLKTGIYYLRIKAAADAQKFTIDPLKHAELIKKPVPADEICEMCSS
jgi:ribonucleoside-diphosphate reductase alpha chain